MHPHAQLSGALKAKLADYVLVHFKRDFEESTYGTRDDDDTSDNPNADISYFDSFLLFGETRSKERVLDAAARESTFSTEEKEVLREWRDRAFTAFFEVRAIHETHMELYDVCAEVSYDVYSNMDTHIPDIVGDNIRVGFFMLSNVAPTHGTWFLSGMPVPLPAHMRRHVYEGYGKARTMEDMYRNNPEKLARGFALQKEQYDAFVQFFGSDEVYTHSEDVPRTMAEFYRTSNHRNGMSDVHIEQRGLSEEALRAYYTHDMREPEDVGIVMDEREGLHIMSEYRAFTNAFVTPTPTMRDLHIVASYLTDGSIPALVFRRARDREPEHYARIMSTLLAILEKPTHLAHNFEATMDTFKPDWRDIYPSVHPMNQFFAKEIYEDTGVQRNDPCPCNSGKKFKKCHGQ